MSFLVLVVDDEPDVEMLFRQQFRRDLRDNRFRMDFAQSAGSALQRIGDAAGESLILCKSAPKHDPSNVMWIRDLSCRSASGPHAD